MSEFDKKISYRGVARLQNRMTTEIHKQSWVPITDIQSQNYRAKSNSRSIPNGCRFAWISYYSFIEVHGLQVIYSIIRRFNLYSGLALRISICWPFFTLNLTLIKLLSEYLNNYNVVFWQSPFKIITVDEILPAVT